MGKYEIWIALRSRGYSPAATAAIMGNMQAESAFLSNNVEDRCRLTDAEYTAAVDSGRISRQQFVGDALGYGLCQWTYSTRKAGLYNLCKQRGVSISDTAAQLDYLGMELADHEYQPVKQVLDSGAGASLYEMTRVFMALFERPADQSLAAINYRAGLAQDIYNEISGVSLDRPAETGQDESESFWPPRMVDEGMEGPDVQLYQSALLCHGYSVLAVNGVFDASTTKAVRQYQQDHGLAVDGVIGPITGRSLLHWG